MANIERRLAKGEGETTAVDFTVKVGQIIEKVTANSPEHAYTLIANKGIYSSDASKKQIKSALRDKYGGWRDRRKAYGKTKQNQ